MRPVPPGAEKSVHQRKGREAEVQKKKWENEVKRNSPEALVTAHFISSQRSSLHACPGVPEMSFILLIQIYIG